MDNFPNGLSQEEVSDEELQELDEPTRANEEPAVVPTNALDEAAVVEAEDGDGEQESSADMTNDLIFVDTVSTSPLQAPSHDSSPIEGDLAASLKGDPAASPIEGESVDDSLKRLSQGEIPDEEPQELAEQ